MYNYETGLVIWLIMSVIFCFIALADYYVDNNPETPFSRFINSLVDDKSEENDDKES